MKDTKGNNGVHKQGYTEEVRICEDLGSIQIKAK
jgi:hypothetical protein